MAVAALQQSVSQNMVRTPVAPVPPVLTTVPAETVVQPVEVAPVLAAQSIEVEPVANVAAAISAFAHLSDFAFGKALISILRQFSLLPLLQKLRRQNVLRRLLNRSSHSSARLNGTMASLRRHLPLS